MKGSKKEDKKQKSGSFVDVRLGGKEYRVDLEVYEKLANGELKKVPHGSALSKSVSAMAIMGLLPTTARVSGDILFNDISLPSLSEKEYRQIRGKKIGYIFQNPLAALNPVFTIANQMIETIQLHHVMTKDAARDYAINLLHRVKIVDPEKRIDDYPHQF